MVGLECVERFGERARHLRDAAILVEQVPVGRLAGVEALLDPIQPGHQHRRESEVRIRGGVGTAELDPLGLGRVRVHRDPDAGRAVALGVDEVHRRLVARDEPAIRVRRRRTEGEQRRRMGQEPADVGP